MSRQTDTMTVSLPREMMKEVDRISRKEGRTRSELVREAIRRYAAVAYQPTKRELERIKKGRAEIRRGAYFTLDEFQARPLARPHRQVSTKKFSARAKA